METSSDNFDTASATDASAARLIFGDLWEFDPAPESADPRIKSDYDLFIGGSGVSPSSGQTFESINPANEKVISRIPEAGQADVDSAFLAADKAYRTVWSRMPGRERGKYLFRIARLLQDQAREFAVAETIDGGKPIRESRDFDLPMEAAHFFYHAGWADKYEQVLGSTNPVAGPYFDFTACEPMGVIALASEAPPYPAIMLGEILAVSDLPAGVVNLLTGSRREILPAFAIHAHIRSLDVVIESRDEKRELGLGAAESVKRLHCRENPTWSTEYAESINKIRRSVEFKTTWHPIGA
jgi:acyl-CoA reductase-like NAD-dependent aldehyde dehydrogenase